MSLLQETEAAPSPRKGLLALIGVVALAGGVAVYLEIFPADWLSLFRDPDATTASANPPPSRAEAPPAPAPTPEPEPIEPKPVPAPEPEPERAPEPVAAPSVPESRLEPLLTVSSDVKGASVFLNREFLGTTPLETLDVRAGTHRLNVSAEGFEGFADTIEIRDDPVTIEVRFRDVRLDARVDVVHEHRFGSCSGTLLADLQGVHYETLGDDAFSIPLADIEEHAIDYLEHTLTVKQRDGRTYNFTDEQETSDALFVFHRDVERARERLAASSQ